MEPVEGLAVEIIFETSHLYKARVINTDITFFTLDKGGKLNTPVPGFRLNNFFYTIAVNYSLYAYNSNDIKSEGDWLPGLFHKNDGYQTPLVLNPFRKDGNIDINNENHLVKARLIANLLAYGGKIESLNWYPYIPIPYNSLNPFLSFNQLIPTFRDNCAMVGCSRICVSRYCFAA